MNTVARLPDCNHYLDRGTATPLIPVRLDADGPTIWCKLEFLNPSGSTKDRIAGYILHKAVRTGRVAPGGLVVEASSGSTSIAMALASAQLGLKFLAVMPEGVSSERRMMIEAYGGEVRFSPRAEGILGALAGAAAVAAERGAFLPLQFENPDNPAAHRGRTAQEVLAQIPGGCVDAVVSGVGTGGTLVGLFEGLCDHGCSPTAFAARPVTGAAVGGAGAECCSFSGRIPGVVDGPSTIYTRFRAERGASLVEIDVRDDEAVDLARRLIRKGFPVGPSSGLNFRAAMAAAERLGPEARIVTVFPDRMERYFSTELFARAIG
ncbi:PLP-dependent cysteine synthase family protein [Paludisphaera soli]|uniref:PLP-dependent cysteine synthase family protein n=1 Tax=Paludisphaera soli TaxID=2712865 RepID=UPI0013EB805D|nr:pyridoxal-phosphate dependent enzyme [Paludisphaera soli]